MATSSAVYKVAVVMFVTLLVVQQFGVCWCQWAQTNGWGGAGVGKRVFQQSEFPQRCKMDPYIALLISRLAKLEAERLRACETDFSADDSK